MAKLFDFVVYDTESYEIKNQFQHWSCDCWSRKIKEECVTLDFFRYSDPIKL